MKVDYNDFAKTFSKSRINMKWEEIDYFLEFLNKKNNLSILDVGSWNARLLWELINKKIDFTNYLWVDLSIELINQAKDKYKNFEFMELDMLNLDKINKKFDVIFFIASFHHLSNITDRINVLKKANDLLNDWWIIFMTNWALNSNLNQKKYNSSIILWSDNEFWSIDYNIKIWKYTRFYHCFDLKELVYLFEKAWFEIIKNQLFTNFKNFICILKKK